MDNNLIVKEDMISELIDEKEEKDKELYEKEILEKKEKEEAIKKKNKKIKVFFVVILSLSIFMTLLFLSYKYLPRILAYKGKYHEVNFIIDYDENIYFNKYDLNASFNGSSIGSISQGEEIEYSTSLPNGEYIITFLQSDEPANTISSVITIDGDTNIEYEVKAGWRGLKYKDKINPDEFELSKTIQNVDEMIANQERLKNSKVNLKDDN